MDERKFFQRMEAASIAAALRRMVEEDADLEEVGVGAEDVFGLLAKASRSRDEEFRADLRAVGQSLLWGGGDRSRAWLEGWGMWREAEELHRGEDEARAAALGLRAEVWHWEGEELARRAGPMLAEWMESDALSVDEDALGSLMEKAPEVFAGERGARRAGKWLASAKGGRWSALEGLAGGGAAAEALRAGAEEAPRPGRFLADLLLEGLEREGGEAALAAVADAARALGEPMEAGALLALCAAGREELARELAPLGARLEKGWLWGPGSLSREQMREAPWIPEELDGARVELAELCWLWRAGGGEETAARVGESAGARAGRPARSAVLIALEAMRKGYGEAVWERGEKSAREDSELGWRREAEAARLEIESGRGLEEGGGPDPRRAPRAL